MPSLSLVFLSLLLVFFVVLSFVVLHFTRSLFSHCDLQQQHFYDLVISCLIVDSQEEVTLNARARASLCIKRMTEKKLMSIRISTSIIVVPVP